MVDDADRSAMPQRALLNRPADHAEQGPIGDSPVILPRLSIVGWARWIWRQLTSMRTALFLLLLLAIAAIPGSLFPQRSSDPNGVIQHFKMDPEGAKVLDSFQLFNVYTSVWFSAIYLLLFISLIGCVIPRTHHHLIALGQAPPKTPIRLSRLLAFQIRHMDVHNSDLERARLLEEARLILRRMRYRVVFYGDGDGPAGAPTSVSAERGYVRETGNLVFHVALIGILVTIAIGGGFGYTGQRVIVEGQSFVNTRGAYDSFTPGRFFTDSQLQPYSLTLNKFKVTYIENDPAALGFVTDYTATVSTQEQGATRATTAQVKVNEPLAIGGTEVYLLGNGYAPEITVKDPQGRVVFADTVPFLPQDANLTSLGVIKIPDGLNIQVGMIGFFYPTQTVARTGAYFSVYPDLQNPVLTLNVYVGDLGINSGDPKSVYALDTAKMTQLAGGKSPLSALELRPGQAVQLPGGMGSIELNAIKRFASFDIAHDPTQGFVLFFAIAIITGLAAALFVPRRRIWVRITPIGEHRIALEFAGLARGDDPRLASAIDSIANQLAEVIGSKKEEQQ